MDTLSETTLSVPGMTCGNCVHHVGEALRALPGVTDVDVSLARRQARVRHAAGRPPAGQLVAALRAAGYEATAS